MCPTSEVRVESLLKRDGRGYFVPPPKKKTSTKKISCADGLSDLVQSAGSWTHMMLVKCKRWVMKLEKNQAPEVRRVQC